MTKTCLTANPPIDTLLFGLSGRIYDTNQMIAVGEYGYTWAMRSTKQSWQAITFGYSRTVVDPQSNIIRTTGLSVRYTKKSDSDIAL